MKPVGHAIAYYENSSDGDRVVIHAAFPVDTDPAEEHDFAIVDLPAIEQAATIVHRGSMDNVMSSIQTLAGWIDAHGYRSAGYNRELYIEIGDNVDDWVTELRSRSPLPSRGYPLGLRPVRTSSGRRHPRRRVVRTSRGVT